MSEKSNPNQNKYTYKYIQFTATSREKKQIKHFADKEIPYYKWRPYKNPYEALRFGEKLNMGTSQYELVEILTPEKTAKMTPPGKSFEGEPTFF